VERVSRIMHSMTTSDSTFYSIDTTKFVRFGSKADIASRQRHVRFAPKADISSVLSDVRFVPKADVLGSILTPRRADALPGVPEALSAPHG
jgi:hypothetical protein